MKEIILFGVTDCHDCAKQKEVLAKTKFPYKFIEIDTDDIHEMILMNQLEIDDIPTIVIMEGEEPVFKHSGVLASRKIIEAMEG